MRSIAEMLGLNNSRPVTTAKPAEVQCSSKRSIDPRIGAIISGGILGALIGDALGVPVEFSSRSEREDDPVTGMRSGGRWQQPAGTWSDDGSLLLCSAESLIGGLDTGRMGKTFLSWLASARWSARGEVFDIGNTTRASLLRIRDGIPAELAGGDAEDSNGNGSLMRILPVALRLHALPASEVCNGAFMASSITHRHIRSKIACAIYCLVVTHVMRGASLPDAIAMTALDVRSVPGIPADELAVFSRTLDPRLRDVPLTEIRSSGYVLHTLEASLWCALRHDNYRDTVLAAVNLGGDTDTTGAVAGGLAGVIYTDAGLPIEWVLALSSSANVVQMLSRFRDDCA
jgi:ADP-ribosylglycohydrolase